MARDFHTSPFGVAVHPWISKFDTKFNSDGLYHVVLKLEPGKETEAFVDLVRAAAEAAFDEMSQELTPAERKKYSVYYPVVPEEDDQGNPTGNYLANFKQNRIIKFKDGSTKEVTIAVKDAGGKKDVVKEVYGGSVIRVMFTMRNSKIVSARQMGVRLDFSAVQVKELRTSGGGGSRFGSTDGYEETDEREQSAFDPGDDRPVHSGDY